MLDSQTQNMLEVANSLTAEDLEFLKGRAPTAKEDPPPDVTQKEPPEGPCTQEECLPANGISRGERERQRTRESKVSTECVGNERRKHEWWPLDTELVGRIGVDEFTARVVQNDEVKSGRSLLITSGPAQGKICITPTRAALEATEAYRQSCQWGRVGGVTNGWTFWRPKT